MSDVILDHWKQKISAKFSSRVSGDNRLWIKSKKWILNIDILVLISSILLLYCRYCDIEVVALCLKDVKTMNGNDPLFIKIFARFHRDYTAGRLPDWIVTKFRVEFNKDLKT